MTTTVWLEHLVGGRVTYRDSGGILTRCLEAGDEGAPIALFLHGTGAHAESFVRNLTTFGEAGYHAVAIDMLGHGLTDKPPTCGYTIAEYVEHVLGLVNSMSTSEVNLLGESLGGAVAMRAAMTYPDRFTRVVSAVGAGLRPIPPTLEEEAGWERVMALSRSAHSQMSRDDWAARMRWLVHDPDSMPDELVEIRMRIYREPGMQASAPRIYDALGDFVYQRAPGVLPPDELSRFPIPVLYLWTDHNPTTPLSVAQAAFELTPDAEIDVLTGCGHWPQYERADDFNDRVLQFLGRPTDRKDAR